MSKTNTTRREFIGTVGAGFAAASLGAGGSAFGAPAKKQVPPIDFNMIYGYAPEANVEKDDFTFAFWADPQICNVKQDVRMKSGKWEDLPKELQTTEGRLRKSVEMTNAVNPDFVLVLGDVVHQSGEMEYYERYIKTTEGLKPPQYLLAGNHDFCEPWYANQKYKSEEGKEFFGNFRWAQRTLNGLDKVNYSFDAGRWHIVMFSVPGVGGNLQAQFLKDYPQHIEWLEKDLRQHRDKPTIFCSHPPFLPVGRVSMEHYGPNSRQRRELVEIITRQGNVKLCLFGHIHNTVSSIPKVAWRYKGAAWFTLPTTSFDGVRDHDYEEDARTSYGFGTIRVKGDRLGAMKFRTLAGEEFTFGYDDLKEYDHAYMDSLWEDFELPANPQIVNGDFEKPVAKGWFLSDMLEDRTPPLEAIRAVHKDAASDRRSALWMLTGAMSERQPLGRFGHRVQIKQAVSPPAAGDSPVLSFDYKMPKDFFTMGGKQCAFVFVTGHRKDEWSTNIEWHVDIPLEAASYPFRLKYALGFPVKDSFKEQKAVLQSDPVFDKWQTCRFDIRKDFERSYPELDWAELNLDSIVVTLGVWNLGQAKAPEKRERAGVFFDKIEWTPNAKEIAAAPEFKLLATADVKEIGR